MPLPTNITKKHIELAIERIDREGIPSRGNSNTYDVLDASGKRYPPKLVVSYANVFANGKELDRRSFEGGEDTEAFRLLERHGYLIVPKKSSESDEADYHYYEEILKFLEQDRNNKQPSTSPNLKTSQYRSSYRGLNVRVSFGAGNLSRIPWIAFLSGENKVSDGIYPVYLLYPEKRLLILAYGVSETKAPENSWTLEEGTETISEYFTKHKLGSPERYGQSYVYRAYDLDQLPSQKVIEGDLDFIVEEYLKTSSVPTTKSSSIASSVLNVPELNSDMRKAGYRISSSMLLNYVSALITKPFVILTGLSGSGKTKLAEAFAAWICENDSQFRVIPVGADWTNRDPLLGYADALDRSNYVLPENGALSMLIEASKPENAGKPYFLILDEMNLSHVEKYFADFLSVMESNGFIHLHSSSALVGGVPSRIQLPPNLFIVGTVNIDETTYMFSPKVLDRANVIEFRVSESQMEEFLSSPMRVDVSQLKGAGASVAKWFVEKAGTKQIQSSELQELNKEILRFFNQLKTLGAEFGYRSAYEIARFAGVVQMLNDDVSINEVIDGAVIQKLLPKVHGSRRKLEPVLIRLAGICLHNEEEAETYLKQPVGNDGSLSSKYPLSLEKIKRMYQNAVANGFASFAEA